MSEWDLPIPELTPQSVEATGAYVTAFVICVLIYAIAVIIWKVPGLSRSTRAEARSTWMKALISIAIISSLLSAEFIISMLNSYIGIPDWRQVIEEAPKIWEMGKWYVSFVQVAIVPFVMALALLGVLATVFLPLSLIVNLIHGVFSYFGWFLVFVGIVAVISMMFAKVLQLIVRVASIAYAFIAAGVAMFPVKWTRRIAITLIVFGLVMYYGLPAVLGAVTPAQTPPKSPEELAKANLLKSLNKETTPVNLVVAAEYGGILPWSYLEMNSSVEYEVPLNLTESSLPDGSKIIGTISYDNKTFQLATYNFTYTRFYNGCYTNPFAPSNVEVMYPSLYLIKVFVSSWNLAEKRWSVLGRTMLYKNSTIDTLWYLGYELNVSNPEINIEGLDMEHPDEDLKNVKSEQEYYDKIYAKSPIHVVEAKAVDPLNLNSTAFIHYSPEIYLRNPHNYVERLDKGEYLYKFRLHRKSYRCWVSRVENVTDPETNQSKLIYYYKASATYEGESDELYLSFMEGTNPRAEIESYKAADREKEGYEPKLITSVSSPGAVVARGLARDFHPVKVANQYKLEEEFGGIGESQIEAAEESGYLPGEAVPEDEHTYTHVIEKPKEVVLDPVPEVYSYRIKGYAKRTSGERRGRCPSLPSYLDVEAKVKFSADDTNAWSPIPLMAWEPMTEWGERSYHLLYEVDPKHELTNKPELLQFNEAPVFSILKGGLGGGVVGILRLIPFVGDLVKWVLAVVIPLMLADGVCALVGGVSIGKTLLSTGGRMFASAAGTLRLLRGRTYPRVGEFFKLSKEIMDKDLSLKIEQQKLKAGQQSLLGRYANITKQSLVEAMKEPKRRLTISRKPLFGGRLTIPYIKTEYPRARAMMDYRQSASRLLPEQAALAQKLANPVMVKPTREEAIKFMKRAQPALMYTEEGKKIFKTLLFGDKLSRSKVSELLLKGDMKVDRATERNLAFLTSPMPRLIYGMFLPEAYPLVYKAEKERLKRELGYESRFRYFAGKHIAHLPEGELPDTHPHAQKNMPEHAFQFDDASKPEEAPESTNTMGEILRHDVMIEYHRGDLRADISVKDGRQIKVFHPKDLDRDVDLKDFTGADEDVADVIGTARGFYEDAPREDVDDRPEPEYDREKIRELAEHTHEKGYDWWWTPSPVTDLEGDHEPKPEDFMDEGAGYSGELDDYRDEREITKDSSSYAITSRLDNALDAGGSPADIGQSEEVGGVHESHSEKPPAEGGEAEPEAEPVNGEPDLLDYMDHAEENLSDHAHSGFNPNSSGERGAGKGGEE